MAATRSRKNNVPPPKKPVSIIFWTLFFIILICLFFVNWHLIQSSVENTGLFDRLFNKTGTQEIENPATDAPPPDIPPAPGPALVPEPLPELPGIAEDPLSPAEPLPDTVVETPLPAVPETPPAVQPVAPVKPATPAAETNRALYFIQVDGDGVLLRTRVNRTVAVSDSPLEDVLRLLLQGPTAAEKNRDSRLRSLIPPGTKLLRAEVRGATAYISFSEEFQFNSYGVEGYVGQLQQILWTVTEFPNIKDVQILIEGRRIDYLGERIAIGSPLSRSSF